MKAVRGRAESDDSVDRWSRQDWWGVVLDAPDAPALAHFYSDLLGWEISGESPEDAALSPTSGVAYLAIQTSEGYVRPTWPNVDQQQQMMMHLDFQVDDMDAAVAHALELGAEEAEHQPQEDVRVMLDPAGHPFCLYTDKSTE
jgi:catechol 2,3-dioxygenase-like lactoylglutathione lyase family enzyme